MRTPRRPARARFVRVVTALVVGAGGLVASVAGLAGLAALGAGAASASVPHREVSGWVTYYANDAGSTVATNNTDMFSDASEFWFHATDATTIVPSGTTPDTQLAASIAGIRAHGVPVTITVTDGTGSGGMAAILSNPATRGQHEQTLIALAQKYGASGIDLDYENMAIFANGNTALTQPTRAGFDALVHELSGALHARHMILAVEVMTKTSEPGSSAAGQVYDYPTIGRWADRVRIMTYDQHYAGSKYPGGAVSGVNWVDSILAFATTVIPAAKLYMGVPLYGYDWSSAGGRAKAVSFPQAQALLQQYNAKRLWSVQGGAPYFSYTDAAGAQHTVWYNDAQALQARLPLVGKYGLGGVAFWSFGNEDPGIWQVLRTSMYGPNPFGTVESARLWPGGVRVGGWAIDPNSTGPINVDLYADGKFLTRTSASIDRPDVGNIYFAYGTTHGYDTVVSLPPGQHQICAYGINIAAGDANPKLGCVAATVPTNNPLGHLEAAAGKAGVLSVSGWTLDPDTSASLTVHVYVDGRWAGAVAATGNRPDVAGVYAGWGAAHGFSTSVNVSGGTHQVCVYALNQGRGDANPVLGCRVVSVTSGNPFGSVEKVVVAAGTATVSGWAIDPSVTGPIGVAVYVDGRLLSNATAANPRPDVGAVDPADGPNHGYSVTVNTSAGRHQVCVYGLNVGPGDANPSLGCATVSVPNANPVGHLESVSGSKGSLTAVGWALDPNTSSSIEVAIYVDGVLALRQTAGVTRLDVAAAYPGFGSAHGFALPVTAAAGKHTVCAFGINTGPGDTNTPLGCKAVTTT